MQIFLISIFLIIGTRFGPLLGARYAKDSIPNTPTRKYFWAVSILIFFLIFYDSTLKNFLGS